MNSEPLVSRENGELDVFAVLADLWRERWLIGLMTIGSGAAGVAYALLATEWYESQVVMVQVEGSALPSGLSQLSGLASLAGINIGAGGQDRAPLAVLRSREFATGYILKENLLPVLFSDKWDPVLNTWKDKDPRDQPDVRDAVRYFNKKVKRVFVDDDTGLITVSVMWKEPEASARWANQLVTEVNSRLRSQALEEAERNIKYLTEVMAGSNVVTLQQPLSRVLESEMQKMMLARGREEFAFKVVDRATPSRDRAKPRRALVSILAAMLGGGFAVLIVLVRRAQKK